MGKIEICEMDDASRAVAAWLPRHFSFFQTAPDEASFKRFCADALPELTGHRAMFAVIGTIAGPHYDIPYSVNLGYPEHLFRAMVDGHHVAEQPTLREWFRVEDPLILRGDAPRDPASPPIFHRIMAELDCLQMSDRAVHGLVEGGGPTLSCIGFFGIDPNRATYLQEVLRFIVPLLHSVLIKLWRHQRVVFAQSLTLREQQLMRLVVEGKTNPEIASEWARSAATVRNQLHGLMRKLNVESRAQLRERAIRSGLVEPANTSGSVLPLTAATRRRPRRTFLPRD